MKSRYNFMSESAVKDTDGNFFPDPLSLNYVSFNAENLIQEVELNEDDIMYLWLYLYQKTGITELDDLILSLNGIEHRNMLTPGSTFYIPAPNDIYRSFTKKKVS